MNPLFKPTSKESHVVDFINNHNLNEFALIRMTSTMLKKSIIDASEGLRNILFQKKLIDFNKLIPGGPKKFKSAIILSNSKVTRTRVSFYRPKTKNGDPRFWIYQLKKEVKLNDLLYLTIVEDQLVVIPIRAISSIKTLIGSIFDDTSKTQALDILFGRLEHLRKSGFIKSINQSKLAPKDVGLTLERFLGISANNLRTPDFLGHIEIKSRRTRSGLSSLFSRVPDKDISKYKSVKEIVLNFGYEDKVNKRTSLYNDITTKPNSQGLYLVPDNMRLILFQRFRTKSARDEVCAWHYETLRSCLEKKHPTTLWVDAKTKRIRGKIHFRYYNFVLTAKPLFSKFISLIDRDIINFDWKAHVKNGAIRDHGPGFRIDKRNIQHLFKTFTLVTEIKSNPFPSLY